MIGAALLIVFFNNINNLYFLERGFFSEGFLLLLFLNFFKNILEAVINIIPL